MTLWELEMEDRPETIGPRLAIWEQALRATGPCDRKAAERALCGLYDATPALEFAYAVVPSPTVMVFAGGFAAGIRQLHTMGAVHYEPGSMVPTVLRGLERAAEMAAHAVVEQRPAAAIEGIAGAILAAVREVTEGLRWPEPDQVAFRIARSCLGEELGAMVDGVVAGDSTSTDWPVPRPGFGGLATKERRIAVLLNGGHPGWGHELPFWDMAESMAERVHSRIGGAMLTARAMACVHEEDGGPTAEHAAYLLRCAERCLAVIREDGACGMFPVFESACLLHNHRRRGLCLRTAACRSHHELAMAAGSQFHHEGFTILCDRPVELQVPDSETRNARLHARYSDGTST